MSAGHTHALIGAVAGLGVVRVLDLPLTGEHTALAAASIIGASTILALLPDIDEPHSWIAQRVRLMIWIVTVVLGGLIGALLMQTRQIGRIAGIDWSQSPHRYGLPLIGMALGSLLGPWIGTVILRVIRRSAGGHRRLTHSGLLAALLAGIAWWAWTTAAGWWAVVPGALAYSIVVHDLGDVVTPAGVPLLYPLSARSFGVPHPLSAVGEPLIQGIAVIAAYLLVVTR